MFFVVRDGDGRVVGRVNIADVEEAAARGLRRVTAMTTEGNLPSQRVLDANGFERVRGEVPLEVEVGGRTEPTVHFVLTLDGPVSRRAGR